MEEFGSAIIPDALLRGRSGYIHNWHTTIKHREQLADIRILMYLLQRLYNSTYGFVEEGACDEMVLLLLLGFRCDDSANPTNYQDSQITKIRLKYIDTSPTR